ncbi:hypothetical protein EJB05_56538, partial [Eragrostis curvula]
MADAPSSPAPSLHFGSFALPCSPPPGSPLSPDAQPFFPREYSVGRSKERRWLDSSPSSAGDSPARRRAPSPAPVDEAELAIPSTGPQRAAPSSAPESGVHARLSRAVPAAAPSRAARRRGKTHLVHGLPLRRPDDAPARPRPTLRSVLVRPEKPATPLVDDEGFQLVQSRRARRRKAKAAEPPRPPPAAGHGRIPPFLAGKCLNCMSGTHRIAQCRLPLRCFRCKNLFHLARDCKRPRSAPSSAGSAGSGNRSRFVRPRRGSATPPASDAPSRTPSPPLTPPPSPPADPDPAPPALEEGLPLGHPHRRPAIEVCIVPRSEAIITEEVRLRTAVVAFAGHGMRPIPLGLAREAVAASLEDPNAAFDIKLFAPENFLILPSSEGMRDRLLSLAGGIPVDGTRLFFKPWTRLLHAEQEVLTFRVAIEMEHVPAHAWNWNTASRILGSSCWIERLDPATATVTNMSKFKLTAWTTDPSRIPAIMEMQIDEPEEEIAHSDPGMQLIFGSLPRFLTQKRVLKYYIIIHIRNIADFNPRSPSTSYGPSPPSSDGDSGHDGNPDRGYGESQGIGPKITGFRCFPGVPDGELPPPNSGNGGGCAGQQRETGIPTERVKAKGAEQSAAVCSFPDVEGDKIGSSQSRVTVVASATAIPMEALLPTRSCQVAPGPDPMCDEVQSILLSKPTHDGSEVAIPQLEVPSPPKVQKFRRTRSLPLLHTGLDCCGDLEPSRGESWARPDPPAAAGLAPRELESSEAGLGSGSLHTEPNLEAEPQVHLESPGSEPAAAQVALEPIVCEPVVCELAAPERADPELISEPVISEPPLSAQSTPAAAKTKEADGPSHTAHLIQDGESFVQASVHKDSNAFGAARQAKSRHNRDTGSGSGDTSIRHAAKAKRPDRCTGFVYDQTVQKRGSTNHEEMETHQG